MTNPGETTAARAFCQALEALGVQLGVLLGNVALWQELAQARERLEHENRYFRQSVPAATAGSQLPPE